MNLRLKIVTPLGITLEREVSSVVLPAKDDEKII
jgi:F0F1-type ATP synthase epsilon subunit